MRRASLVRWLGLAVCLALGSGCDGSDSASAAGDSPSPLPVAVVPVLAQDGYRVEEGYPGRVVARRRSELGFERGGRLEEVTVDEGDRVREGQPLARLEQRQLEARRSELRARVQEIRSRLELARLTLKRRGRLKEQESISSQRYDEAVHDERALASQLAAARAALTGTEVELALSTLSAPYAGTVTARLADEGTVVAAGQPLLHLIESDALEFRVGLPPETAGRLAPGSRHGVEIGGLRHAVVLATVVPSVEPNTRTLTAVFHFVPDQPDSEEGPAAEDGSLGRLEVETRREAEGFWLPLTALAEGRRGLWSAYAVVPDGEGGPRVERRQLALIHVESDRAYLRGTLADGDRVVATGLHRLVPGQRVRVAGESSPPISPTAPNAPNAPAE